MALTNLMGGRSSPTELIRKERRKKIARLVYEAVRHRTCSGIQSPRIWEKRFIKMVTAVSQSLATLEHYITTNAHMEYTRDSSSEALQNLKNLKVHTEKSYIEIERIHKKLFDSSVLSTDSIRREIEFIEREFKMPVKLEMRDYTYDDDEGHRVTETTAFLTVRTPEIRLTLPTEKQEVFNFGRFDIELDLYRMKRGNEKPFKVIACDPHTVEGHQSITHPHVKNDELCTGQAQDRISSSLRTGAIYSFFSVVYQTLQVYNPASPFLALDLWVYAGGTCRLCSRPMGEVGMSDQCSACEYDVCGGCHASCSRCGDVLCQGCVTSHIENNTVHCDDCGADGCCIRSTPETGGFTCECCGDLYDDDQGLYCEVIGLRLCDGCLERKALDREACWIECNASHCQHLGHRNCRLRDFGYDPDADEDD